MKESCLTPGGPVSEAKAECDKKASDRESAEAIVGDKVPEGPNVVVLQVTASKSMSARTRSECQGKGIVTRSGRRGGDAFFIGFASRLRSNRQQCLKSYHDVAPYT